MTNPDDTDQVETPNDLGQVIRNELSYDRQGRTTTASDWLYTLRAVVDLHQPRHKGTHPQYLDTDCTQCSMRGVTTITYPCPTIQTIADKLGINLGSVTEPVAIQRD